MSRKGKSPAIGDDAARSRQHDRYMTQYQDATTTVSNKNSEAQRTLPFSDTQDFSDAERGFIASLEPGVVKDASGNTVWDSDAFAFLEGECPPTVNPSLWRQSRLCAMQGSTRSPRVSTRFADSICRT